MEWCNPCKDDGDKLHPRSFTNEEVIPLKKPTLRVKGLGFQVRWRFRVNTVHHLKKSKCQSHMSSNSRRWTCHHGLTFSGHCHNMLWEAACALITCMAHLVLVCCALGEVLPLVGHEEEGLYLDLAALHAGGHWAAEAAAGGGVEGLQREQGAELGCERLHHGRAAGRGRAVRQRGLLPVCSSFLLMGSWPATIAEGGLQGWLTLSLHVGRGRLQCDGVVSYQWVPLVRMGRRPCKCKWVATKGTDPVSGMLMLLQQPSQSALQAFAL